ncbi:MAG TPA: acylphosphatase [Euzebyales bacterium]|nr:acylphosphatase [Euzebyales bacterium]
MTDDDVIRVHLWVSGRVQGVFFRATTSDEARSRGLTGWVRNAPDGRVEAEVQGSRAAVEELIEECRTGPAMAAVSDVVVDHIDVVDNEQRFKVVG